jgi:opacity protein-like surface antigen
MHSKLAVAALLLAAALPSISQVAPAARQYSAPLVIGAGFSKFDSDWKVGLKGSAVNGGRLSGGVLWVDWNFYDHPSFLRGFGLEVEARDLNYSRTGNVPTLREDTAAGGVIYTWRHYRKIHPYGKLLAGLGSIDFEHLSPTYSHDSRTFYAPGGGIEYRAWGNVWVRGDYEYQLWTEFFLKNQTMKPCGLTVGASYDFGLHHRH